MKINLKKRNRIIVIAECVWHDFSRGLFVLPTFYFYKLPEGWTLDIIWLKLYITFGYIKPINKYYKSES